MTEPQTDPTWRDDVRGCSSRVLAPAAPMNIQVESINQAIAQHQAVIQTQSDTAMEDATARELLSALDDRDPTVIRAAMVSYADRVQGVRLQAKAYDLVARQHVQSALFAAPQLGPCAS